jgi:tetratricopeptide (TPR) repeat protein
MFERCGELQRKYNNTPEANDAQLSYNLGLTHFKLANYEVAVEHLKQCIVQDKRHKFAYNNLAFVFNMHQKYEMTLAVCQEAEVNFAEIAVPEQMRNDVNRRQQYINGALDQAQSGTGDHGCHRHWAFALFKRNQHAKAIAKIKQAVEANPDDADNWVVWGLVLRHHHVHQLEAALKKFEQAAVLRPDQSSIQEEITYTRQLMELDAQVSLEDVTYKRRMRPTDQLLKEATRATHVSR